MGTEFLSHDLAALGATVALLVLALVLGWALQRLVRVRERDRAKE